MSRQLHGVIGNLFICLRVGRNPSHSLRTANAPVFQTGPCCDPPWFKWWTITLPFIWLYVATKKEN